MENNLQQLKRVIKGLIMWVRSALLTPITHTRDLAGGCYRSLFGLCVLSFTSIKIRVGREQRGTKVQCRQQEQSEDMVKIQSCGNQGHRADSSE